MEASRLAWKLVSSDVMTKACVRVSGLDDETIASDELLQAYVKANIDTYCHASGVAPIGPSTNSYAVVDQRCRAHGLENLWVADRVRVPGNSGGGHQYDSNDDRGTRRKLVRGGCIVASHGEQKRMTASGTKCEWQVARGHGRNLGE